MKQFIFPFAIKSFDEIVCLTDINQREYLREIKFYYEEYYIIRSNWGSSDSKEYKSPDWAIIGEKIHYLLSSCPFEDLKDSRLFQELTTTYKPFER